MVKPAREKAALLLRGGESTGSFSAETSAPVAGLTLSVDGVGPVKLPVGAPQERALVSVARLRTELHALLVYGPDQFFAPHQDSEKDDEMVATLVVSLPSVHTGGELVVSHGGRTQTYRHADRHTIGFVAFYADCVHEVRPVRSGGE